MANPKPQLTENDAAALMKAFAKQTNEGRVFTLEELQPILAYAAASIARQHDEIQLLAKAVEDLKKLILNRK
jgi:hypothetical protein